MWTHLKFFNVGKFKTRVCCHISADILQKDLRRILLNLILDIFSRGHATLYLVVSVGRFRILLNSERLLHYGPGPIVRDFLAVYSALFNQCLDLK